MPDFLLGGGAGGGNFALSWRAYLLVEELVQVVPKLVLQFANLPLVFILSVLSSGWDRQETARTAKPGDPLRRVSTVCSSLATASVIVNKDPIIKTCNNGRVRYLT